MRYALGCHGCAFTSFVRVGNASRKVTQGSLEWSIYMWPLCASFKFVRLVALALLHGDFFVFLAGHGIPPVTLMLCVFWLRR